MTIIELPFDIENPDVKAGFEVGQDDIYYSTRPKTDVEFANLIRDLLADNPARLMYNVGFLLGLYRQKV